jgi:ubiquinone biosynthesis monooxygenase Coq7
VLGGSEHAPVLRHMLAQEQAHLASFSAILAERGVRPTALLPFWHVAGYVLGAATAALGPRAAMACTVAVEEVIDEHYRAQRDALPESEAALATTIETFRVEELEHRDTGLAHGARQAPFYGLLSRAIKSACKVAIAVSEAV